MRFFTNPIFLHAVVILFFSSCAFVLGLVLMRLLRKSIQEEANVSSGAPAFETMPLHVYNTVIQQLKQQQDELKAQSQTEQQRSRTTERFTEAVLSNLSCGVLNVGKNGLIRSSNPAAKQVLGFASLVGMSVRDVFRSAAVSLPSSGEGNLPALLSDEFDRMLRSGSTTREAQAEYQTPAGESRALSITVVPILASDGEVSAAACLINDITDLVRVRAELATRARPAEASAAAAHAGG